MRQPAKRKQASGPGCPVHSRRVPALPDKQPCGACSTQNPLQSIQAACSTVQRLQACHAAGEPQCTPPENVFVARCCIASSNDSPARMLAARAGAVSASISCSRVYTCCSRVAAWSAALGGAAAPFGGALAGCAVAPSATLTCAERSASSRSSALRSTSQSSTACTPATTQLWCAAFDAAVSYAAPARSLL